MVRQIARTVLLVLAVFAAVTVGWTASRVHLIDHHVADLQGIQNAFEQIAERVGPSVVSIRATRRDEDIDTPPGFRLPFEHAGSGVILDAQGHVLTNEHVVHRVHQVEVVLADGRVCPAELVGADPRSDLAVLQIEADGLQPAELGGFEQVRRGHWALAMGNALGLATDGQASFSHGVVSAIGRVLPQLGRAQDRYYGNLIQSTVEIHQGNSGGPLFDINGRVIGVNTAIGIATDLGIGVGFSIPLDRRAMSIIEKLIAGEPVDYGYMGVQVPVNGLADRDEAGALISDVVPGEPADEAGIQPQDLILTFDGQPIRDEDHLIRLVGATDVGRVVPVTLRRDGRQVTVELKVGQRPAPRIGAQARMRWRGTMLGDLTPEHCDRLDLPGSAEGVLILEVREESPADAAGLQPDQIIHRIGPHEIRSLLDFADFAERWRGPMPIGVLGRDEPLLVPSD